MQTTSDVTMDGVREYAEGMPVKLGERKGRLCVEALNQAGHDGTEVDLLDLLRWVRTNRPDLWQEAK